MVLHLSLWFISCTNFVDSLSIRTSPRIMISFRPVSRNTAGFDKGNHYALPRLEFLACCPTAKFSHLRIPCQSNNSSQVATPHRSRNFFLLEGVKADEAARIARRTILTHSVVEILGTSYHSRGHAIDEAFAASSSVVLRPPWSVIIQKYDLEGRPIISKISRSEEQVIEDKIADKMVTMGGPQTFDQLRVDAIHDTFILFEFTEVNNADYGGDQLFVVARRLAHGPAVGPRGDMSVSPRRRPRGGALGSLALHNRLARVPTSMEPEIALVMGNLARVGLPTRSRHESFSWVLDPFCGGAGLLIPAAYLAEKNDRCCIGVATVGFDAASFEVDLKLRSKIHTDCINFGISNPKMLATANILDWKENGSNASAALDMPSNGQFSAIIADPPYGLKAALVEKSHCGNAAQETDATERLFSNLLEMAAAKLEPGGRLVCFFPSIYSRHLQERNTIANMKSTELLRNHIPIPPVLRMRHTVPQIFRGGTFMRALVVFEKVE